MSKEEMKQTPAQVKAAEVRYGSDILMISAEKSFQLCRKYCIIIPSLMVGRGERTTCSLRRLTRQKVFGFIPETFFLQRQNSAKPEFQTGNSTSVGQNRTKETA